MGSIHWFLFVAVVIALCQSSVMTRFGMRGMTYRRYFRVPTCYQGEEIEMVERIANRKLLPMPWLRLEALIHAGLEFRAQQNLDISSGSLFQNHKSFFSLMPYTQITRRHRILCRKRGCYRLNSATMTYGDVLGIGKRSIQLEVDAELLVYPEPIPMEEVPLPSRSWQGDVVVRRWLLPDPFLIAGVRDYRYGDPLNSINWKATARTGRLQVHQHDYTADPRLIIYVNVEDHAKMWNQVNDEDMIERGIAYAATIARYALEQGLSVGFGTNAYDIDAPKLPVRVEPGSGAAQLKLLQDSMARLVVARSIPFDAFLEEEADRLVADSDILLISAYVSDKMVEPIERLRRSGNTVDVLTLTPTPDRRAERSRDKEGESA